MKLCVFESDQSQAPSAAGNVLFILCKLLGGNSIHRSILAAWLCLL